MGDKWEINDKWGQLPFYYPHFDIRYWLFDIGHFSVLCPESVVLGL